MFCCVTINKKMPILLGKFSVIIAFWARPVRKTRCSCAITGGKDSVPGHFPPREEYGSCQKACCSEGKACTSFGRTLCYIAVALCQAAGAVLVCFLAGLSSRRLLDALESRLSAARCPLCFQVQQRSQWGGSLARRWLHTWCASLPAASVCRQAGQGVTVSPRDELGEALGTGTREPGFLGPWAAQGTGSLFGEPGIRLSQLRARPHLN